MAATVQVRRWTGTGPITKTVIGEATNTRLNAYDTHSTNDTTNPVQIPTGANNYSYWATFRLNCTVTPATQINNIRWYTDGTASFGTGISMQVGQVTMSNGSDTGYVQATGTPGVTGTQLLAANYTGLTPATPDDAFGKTSASPLTVTGSLANPNTGDFGNAVILQITVANTASPGPTAVQETCTWKYDES